LLSKKKAGQLATMSLPITRKCQHEQELKVCVKDKRYLLSLL